jgi:two-component system response regulator LytT
VRVVVVEDEEIVARRVIRLVRKILGDALTSLDHRPTLGSALEYIRNFPIDLLLLDLDLHGENGFRLLTSAAADRYQTIIVSARHDQALRAFEFGVTDFVPKPFDEARLRQALDRVENRDDALRARTRYLAIRKGTDVIQLPLADVRYIHAADDYSEIHGDDGSTHLHAKTLTALSHLLPANFHRIHRSFIVNLKCVRTHRSHGGGRYDVVLEDGTALPVSRTRVRELRDVLL